MVNRFFSLGRLLTALVLLLMAVACGQAVTTAADGDWSLQSVQIAPAPEADLVARTGDIDNLYDLFAPGFNPFSGRSTAVHDFPWTAKALDALGTDRIMVGSSYSSTNDKRFDGYIRDTVKKGTPIPLQSIALTYNLNNIKVTSAALQMFIDDFQAPDFGSSFEFSIDGARVPIFEEVLNYYNQGGPIGKIITLFIPDDMLDKVKDGSLQLKIDDTTTGAGDGFAISFVKLLINPKQFSCRGNITGKVTSKIDGGPFPGITVVADGYYKTVTGADGSYKFSNIPAGSIVVLAEKDGIKAHKIADLIENETATVDIELNVPASRPDLLIKSGTNMIGLNIFNTKAADTDATTQKALVDMTGEDASFYVKIGNTGSATGSYRLVASSSDPTWSFTAFDAVKDGKDITGEMTSKDGYLVKDLAIGAAKELLLKATPGEKSETQNIISVYVVVDSMTVSADSRLDQVVAYVQAPKAYQPDLVWISPNGEVWKEIYDNNAGLQTAETEQQLGAAKTYRLCVHNYKSKRSAVYTFNGSAADDGWTINYFDESKDITAAVNSPEGYTLPVIDGGGFYGKISFQVTPKDTLAVGTTTRIGLLLRSNVGDIKQDDGAFLITTTAKPVLPTYLPDLLIRGLDEDPFLGDHVRNDLTTQTAALATSRNAPASYSIMLHNLGTATEPMVITGTTVPDGWTVQYFDAWNGGADITAAVTGAGWTTRDLEPFGRVFLRIEMTPDTTVAWGDKQTVTLTATSTADPAQADAVAATTTCANLPISRVRLRATPAERIQVNHTVTLTATPVGGRQVLYSFYVYDGSGWRVIQNYGASRTCAWMPKTAGKYALLVWAKEKTSTAQWDVNATLWQYVVDPTVTGVTLAATPTSQGTVGVPVTLTATPLGGSNLVYAFYQKEADNTLTLLRDFAASEKFTWTPTVAGRYNLVVQTRAADSEVAMEATGALNGYTVNVAAP